MACNNIFSVYVNVTLGKHTFYNCLVKLFISLFSISMSKSSEYMRSIYKNFMYTYKSNIWVYKHTYDIAYHSSELGRVFLTTCNTIIQDCNGIREDAKRKREILIRSRYIIHKVFHTCIPMVPRIVVLNHVIPYILFSLYF